MELLQALPGLCLVEEPFLEHSSCSLHVAFLQQQLSPGQVEIRGGGSDSLPVQVLKVLARGRDELCLHDTNASSHQHFQTHPKEWQSKEKTEFPSYHIGKHHFLRVREVKANLFELPSLKNTLLLFS